MALLGLFIALVFLYSLVSRRLERTVVTAPIVFTVAGMLVSLSLAGMRVEMDREHRLLIAEIALVMLLFTDGTRISLRVLKGNRQLPVRLLTTGMLMTIALGALAALALFRGLSLWQAGILAAVLAPTDAALGEVVVSNPSVPLGIRQALSVEAGLNDGLAVPFLMFFIALALQSAEGPPLVLSRYLAEQLGYGTLIGLGIGVSGGWLLDLARRRGWMATPLQQLGLAALPALCVLASEATGASMFIAAYAAGLGVQVGFKEAGRHSIAFVEGWGQLLSFFVFFLFGLRVVELSPLFSPVHALYAVLSLTIVRIIPVALALAGTGLDWSTVLFMGWFGPRGLASIVLGLVYLGREANLTNEGTMLGAVMLTVLLSVFAHGLSALPGIALYARRLASLGPDAPECRAIEETDPPGLAGSLPSS